MINKIDLFRNLMTVRYMERYGSDEQKSKIAEITETYMYDEDKLNYELNNFYIQDCISRN